MKIMIGAPVRNRAWVLTDYCNAIAREMLYSDISFDTCFVVNDCADNSKAILDSYGFKTIEHDLNENKSAGHVRGLYSFKNLAILRNRLLEAFLESDCTHFLSVDSDIVIPDKSVVSLAKHNLDIVSMLLKNHPTLDAYNIMVKNKWQFELNNDAEYVHIIPKTNDLMEVDITGAVYMISRRVIEDGVRYGDYNGGEDLHFCQEAQRLGYRLYCDTRLKAEHRYAPDMTLYCKEYYD